MKMLSEFRKLARKWPEEYRLKTVDEFVEAIGSYTITANSRTMDQIWSRYKATGELPEGAKVMRLASGEEYALTVTNKQGIETRFVNLILPGKKLYNWRNMCTAGYCEMIKSIR